MKRSLSTKLRAPLVGVLALLSGAGAHAADASSDLGAVAPAAQSLDGQAASAAASAPAATPIAAPVAAGQVWPRIVTPEDRPELREALASALQKKSSFGSNVEMQTYLQGAMITAGFPSVAPVLSEQDRTIYIGPHKFVSTDAGVYAPFIAPLDGASPSNSQVEAANRQLAAAAAQRGDAVALSLGAPVDGGVPMGVQSRIAAGGVSERKTFDGGFITSPYGPRYSGPQTTTEYVRWNGERTSVMVNATQGIPGLSADSKGGSYFGGGGELRYIGDQGTHVVTANAATYKIGGPLRDFDYNGDSKTLGYEYQRPLSKYWTAVGGIYGNVDTMRLGTFSLKSTQYLLSGKIGVSYNDGRQSFSVSARQGLYGHESYNDVPLQGRFNPNATTLNLDYLRVDPLSDRFTLTSRATAQVSPGKGVPNSMQIYGGGLYGGAFNPGIIAGNSGVGAGATLTYDAGSYKDVHFKPYASVDGMVVSPNAGGAQHVASATLGVGASTKIGATQVEANAFVAMPINTNVPGASKSPRFGVGVTFRF